MLILVILSAVIASLTCALLCRVGQVNARRYALDMPQRFHAGHVPRLGGAAMVLGCTAGWVWGMLAASPAAPLRPAVVAGWWAVMVLAAGAGLAEDITHRVSARWRMALTLVAGGVGVLALPSHRSPGPALAAAALGRRPLGRHRAGGRGRGRPAQCFQPD